MIDVIQGIAGIAIMIIVLGCVPVILGTLLTYKTETTEQKNILTYYFKGIILMLALMQLLSVPMTLTRQSFQAVVVIYSGLLIALLVIATICKRKHIVEVLCATRMLMQQMDRGWIVVLGLVYIPIIILTFLTPYIYGDDRTYLTMVNDMIESNTLYQVDFATGENVTWTLSKYSLSSYWTWIAYLAKISMLHPLILCKTVLLYFFIPMSYAVQGLVAGYLFHGNQKRVRLYLIIIALVNLFGGFSNFTVSYRIYTWVWQSKAFLAIIVLPFLFYYCSTILERKTKIRDYLILMIAVTATAATTLTGTGLAVGMIALLGLMYSIKNRRISQLIGTGISCVPALVYMLMHVMYYEVMLLFQF